MRYVWHRAYYYSSSSSGRNIERIERSLSFGPLYPLSLYTTAEPHTDISEEKEERKSAEVGTTLIYTHHIRATNIRNVMHDECNATYDEGVVGSGARTHRRDISIHVGSYLLVINHTFPSLPFDPAQHSITLSNPRLRQQLCTQHSIGASSVRV